MKGENGMTEMGNVAARLRFARGLCCALLSRRAEKLHPADRGLSMGFSEGFSSCGHLELIHVCGKPAAHAACR